MNRRRFVDTPGTPGEGSASARRLAKVKAENDKLRRACYVGASLIVGLISILIVVFWTPKAQASNIDVHPARPGYSRVVVRPVDEPVVTRSPDGLPVMSKKDAEAREKKLELNHDTLRLWLSILLLALSFGLIH